ncbi:hypothetical protein OHB33_40825 (plasmid) [Streptomyces sp. NBC_01558]|uniref:hypothetical protein n=1 Tax=Streptomyces sp. NBC_01558 TaxID=2975878 RepID=UPI002DD9CF67|nr:hypothetical protein [Streptomyces sp. NBC_01558]WSD82733.1 hypothetical protein OHB33_40825 [Streptomyces sp. NBC_01558]
MTTLDDTRLIAAYGTGLQSTRITRQPDGTIRWQRSPGPNHPTGAYPPVPAAFTEQARTASSPLLRFATPHDASAHHASWDTHGPHSAARALLTEDDPTQQIHDTLGRLGNHLTTLHTRQIGRPHTTYQQPPGLTRLQSWLEHGRGPRASAGFHHRLRNQLGPDRLDKLRSYTHALLQPTSHDTTLHGWLTLGSIVPTELKAEADPGPGDAVLSGIEAACGRPEADLANIVGELEEFRLNAELTGTPRPFLHRLTATFLQHYGPGWDRAIVAAGAVARIATHAHDFAAYVGWHPSLHTYIPMLADLIDCDGTTALPDT